MVGRAMLGVHVSRPIVDCCAHLLRVANREREVDV
jgi:hypothetical protein